MDPSQRRTRRPTRLSAYDYGWPGSYFVTAVTFQRALLFKMSEAQEVINSTWWALPQRFPDIGLDAFVVMPNHIHGIVTVKPRPSIVGEGLNPPGAQTSAHQPTPRSSMLLTRVMAYFKSNSARAINVLRDMTGVPVWQRSYYEHVIRGEDDLNRVREYIVSNPLTWAKDEHNPENDTSGWKNRP